MKQAIALCCVSVLVSCTANVEITKVKIDEPTSDEAREVVAAGGDTIQFRDLELTVPDGVGEGVAIAAETDDGWIQVEVENRGDGVAAVRIGASEPVTTVEDTASSATNPACADGAYVLTGHRWRPGVTYGWYLSTQYNPTSALAAAIGRGANNVVSSRNDCGLADEVSALHAYRGPTNVATQSGNGTCGTRDGRNIVGLGSLPSYMAYTCWWWDSAGYTIESDIRFRYNHNWITTTYVTPGCTTAVHLESVATHEFGHVFGLNHPGAIHASQTMQPGGACDNSKATLGLGDVRGLRAYY